MTTAAPTRGLTVRYVLALVLVGVTSVTAYVLLSALIEHQRGSAVEINISGRQRMLSQRTALFALNLATDRRPERQVELRATLHKLIALLRKSNEGLVHGNAKVGLPGNPAPPLQDLYFGPTDLYARVRKYSAALTLLADDRTVSTDSPTLKEVLANAPGLLVDLNRAVKAYEAEATANVDFLHGAEGALVLFTLILLLVEALLIFRPLVAKITAHIRTITEQSDVLERRERDMRMVLNSTGDGLVAVNPDGSLRDIRSKVVADWFKEDEPVWTGLFPTDVTKQEEMALAFEGIVEDIMPFEVVVDQVPKQFTRDGHTYGLEVRPIGDDSLALLLVIRDITAEIAQARAERENRELVQIVRQVGRDRDGFVEFLEEMDNLLDIISSSDLSDADLKRILHTMKGNAAIYEFGTFAERCHHLESRLEDVGELTVDDLTELDTEWRLMLSKIEVFVEGSSSKDILQIDREDYDALIAGVRDQMDSRDLLSLVKRWRDVPARRRLDRIGQQVTRLSTQVGKPVEVEIDDHRVRIPPSFLKDFWPSLIHVVRNALDHGIEQPDERTAAGKPEQGKIRVSSELRDDFVLRIEDDGRGIDWQRVREKAEKRGLRTDSDEDLVDALFADGVSTRDQVTELSGRGVGMSDVRARCEAAGGRVEVQSTLGHGAAFEFRFPAPPTPRTQDLAAS